MLLFLMGCFTGAAMGILVAALCVAAKDHNPCCDCVIYLDPEGDYRKCFDCERGKARAETFPQN